MKENFEKERKREIHAFIRIFGKMSIRKSSCLTIRNLGSKLKLEIK